MPYIAKFANFVVYSYYSDSHSLVTLRLYRLRRGAFNLTAVARHALGRNQSYYVVNRHFYVEIIPTACFFKPDEFRRILRRLRLYEYMDVYESVEPLTGDGCFELRLRVEDGIYLWSILFHGVPFLNAEGRESAKTLRSLISAVRKDRDAFLRYLSPGDGYARMLNNLEGRLAEEEFWK